MSNEDTFYRDDEELSPADKARVEKAYESYKSLRRVEQPRFRVLRVIEYVGTREFLDNCISRRVVKGSYHTKNGFIQEAILGDFQELVEPEPEIEVLEPESKSEEDYSAGGPEDYNPGNFGLG